MAFKGLKKSDKKTSINHFEEIKKSGKSHIQIGRPNIDEYKKQNKRIQFYVSQELIDALLPIALQNGCKDVTAYAKKILKNEVK